MVAYSFSQKSGEVTSPTNLLVTVNAVNRYAACMDSFDGILEKRLRFRNCDAGKGTIAQRASELTTIVARRVDFGHTVHPMRCEMTPDAH
jgi:hypothetical protein